MLNVSGVESSFRCCDVVMLSRKLFKLNCSQTKVKLACVNGSRNSKDHVYLTPLCLK